MLNPPSELQMMGRTNGGNGRGKVRVMFDLFPTQDIHLLVSRISRGC